VRCDLLRPKSGSARASVVGEKRTSIYPRIRCLNATPRQHPSKIYPTPAPRAYASSIAPQEGQLANVRTDAMSDVIEREAPMRG
jgi:hypothetical protein